MADYDFEAGAARETLCRLLAACYYQPGPEFAEERVFEAIEAAAARVDPALGSHARRFAEAFAAEDLQSLLVDYTRLFLGPVGALARPYGSVWLGAGEGLMQDSTMAVLALYAEGGFEISVDFRELPDHVAAELEFLYLLLYRENEARRNADADALTAATALRTRFLDEHLGRWIGPFTEAARAGAQTAYYRALAELTAGFVRMEVEDRGRDRSRPRS